MKHAPAAPTERELEILKILWDLGEASVRQVFDVMRAREDIAQNTVQTFLRMMEDKGLVVGGRAPATGLCEMIELPADVHPWFVGCQFHPEFTSNPRKGHPLFIAYVKAAIARKAAQA